MKVAMWAVFIFLLGIGGLLLISLFGNITTTNQQDFTLVRNTVEAAMNDAIDRASYRAGFYLCPKDTALKDATGKYIFNSKDDYEIVLNHNVDAERVAGCDLLVGEIKLNADVFVESFIRRYANNVNNNKSYQITVQEVIEYPPKVSIQIVTNEDQNSATTATFDSDDITIKNQVDAIFESTEKTIE